MAPIRGFLAVVLLSVALLACAQNKRKMTFADVQSLNPGVSACWVLAEYPTKRVTRWPNGNPRSATYAVVDPAGRNQTLRLDFDQSGTACRKFYSGRAVRPAASSK